MANPKLPPGLVVGILPQKEIRERVLSIARGELKVKESDPKIWFASPEAAAEWLSVYGHEQIDR